MYIGRQDSMPIIKVLSESRPNSGKSFPIFPKSSSLLSLKEDNTSSVNKCSH